jgi:hypothetical protein
MRTSSEQAGELKRALRALTTGTAPSPDSKPSPLDSESPSSAPESLLADSDPPLPDLETPVDPQTPAPGSRPPTPNECASPDPATVVALAHRALADVESAATFVADGGESRLRAAVTTAEQTGDRATARTGQRALATVERYRQAAAGDHFHPGRGTIISPGTQPTSE